MNWNELPLSQKLGNIGSEVNRAKYWEEKGVMESRNKSLDRALELIDDSLTSDLGVARLKELGRLREVLADILSDNKIYSVSIKELDSFLVNFAFLSGR